MPDAWFEEFVRSRGLTGVRVEATGKVEGGWRQPLAADGSAAGELRPEPSVAPNLPYADRVRIVPRRSPRPRGTAKVGRWSDRG